MASMDHENVVRLYSVCMSKQLMLISQFVPNGALIDYLKKNRDKLTASMMLEFAAQISKVRPVEVGYLSSRAKEYQSLFYPSSPIAVKIGVHFLSVLCKATAITSEYKVVSK